MASCVQRAKQALPARAPNSRQRPDRRGAGLIYDDRRSIPTNSLLDFLPMACLLYSVDAFVLNVWRCVAHHVIHDTEEAGSHINKKPFCLDLTDR